MLLLNVTLPDGSCADVAIVGDRIDRIVPAGSLSAASALSSVGVAAKTDADARAIGDRDAIDLTGHMLLPGFVNGHAHLDKTHLGARWQPHREGGTVRARINAERDLLARLDVPVRDRAGALAELMIEAGTATVRTHVDIDPVELDGDGPRSLDTVFAIAQRHGVGVDIHLHAADAHAEREYGLPDRGPATAHGPCSRGSARGRLTTDLSIRSTRENSEKGRTMARKQVRRRTLVLATSASAAILLAGCAGPSDTGDGESPQTITFAYSIAADAQDWYEKLAQGYMDSHPGVTIDIQKYGLDNYPTLLNTQLNAGNGPDVFYALSGTGQNPSVGPLAEAGLVLPLDTEVLEDALPEAVQAGWVFDETFYGVPTSVQVNGLVMNPALAEDTGIEWTAETTLEDLAAQCGDAADDGVAVLGLAGAVPTAPAITTLGFAASTVYGPEPDWNDQRTAEETTFAESDGWKEALQAVKDLYDAGCMQGGAAGAGFDALTNGVAGGTMLSFAAPSSATVTLANASGGALEMSVLPMPAPDGIDPKLVLTSTDGIAGNAKTKSPELVKDFIQWSAQPEQATMMAEIQGTLPLGGDTADFPEAYRSSEALLTSEGTRPYPPVDWPNGAVFDALGSGVTGILTGQLTVEQVLESMDNAWG
ncbi:MAG TPA: extracellular solute-binding protein [Microbacterium sp.]|uniref:extracellular solute-binding protein n=1 Tax=Microbacterium sp. TaxID=51671 RepID=UPI002F94182E